ncbi:response regulator [Heliobacterium gestii]|uniref:Stage 0 sporulation protein A homolog n=1 Tax=Heliomicrobium gestii TaxID=2699 RepID=A0A845LG45_HELGE|nr:response regulator transcription factor [Heliomicrobium gestii]MBM7865576.1 DNA-binding response OmpR family regulator [Heliomicrobium gestii]MZP41826.1 response regulator [Heliomicrobium gestii]
MTAKRILIADDESRMRKLVGDFLKKEGFLVTEAEDGKAALELFFQQPFDLVILDVMMPGYDGWAVCREIRKQSRVPVIMLTAKAEEVDQLFGFDLGADEYVTKPFSPRILVARVQALIRRLENNQKSLLAFGDLLIDQTGRIVTVKGERVDLTPKEFDLLLHLAGNAGKAMSREQVLNAVWDYDYYGDARTVDTHIKKLRLKLGDAGQQIQTVRGLGYRFEAQP